MVANPYQRCGTVAGGDRAGNEFGVQIRRQHSGEVPPEAAGSAVRVHHGERRRVAFSSACCGRSRPAVSIAREHERSGDELRFGGDGLEARHGGGCPLLCAPVGERRSHVRDFARSTKCAIRKARPCRSTPHCEIDRSRYAAWLRSSATCENPGEYSVRGRLPDKDAVDGSNPSSPTTSDDDYLHTTNLSASSTATRNPRV